MKCAAVVAVVLLCVSQTAQAQQVTGDGFHFRIVPDGTFSSCLQNEVCLRSLVDDPPKLRGGVVRDRNSPTWGRGLMAFSGDIVRPGSLIHDELVLMQFKESENASGQKDFGGEWYLGLKKPGESSNDSDMFDAVVASYRQGVRFNLPIYAPNLTGGGAATGHLQAGAFQLHVQASDGNFVLYRLVGDTFCPVWAISWLPHNGTGFIDKSALPQVCQ